MNRIFRKARMSSLKINRIGRYFIYAIGEIILVIVGILIALQINNRNEQAKNEVKVKALLVNIQDDLVSDLDDLKKVIDIYEYKDSLINLVLSDTIDEEDYRKNPALIMLLTTYSGFECKDNAYNNLMRNSDFIPREYNKLIPQLDEIYLENSATIKSIQTEISDLVNSTLLEWSSKYTWYLDLNRGRYNPDYIEFFLNDPFYKNSLVTYQIYASGNLLRLLKQYELLSINAYRSIQKALGSEDEIPESVSNYYVELSEEKMQSLSGSFKADRGIDVKIYIEDEALNGQIVGQPSFDLYAKNDSVLFNPLLGVKLIYGKNENARSGFTFYQNQQEVFFERQDELLD